MDGVLKSNRWTTKENGVLLDLYPTHSARQISKLLNRSVKSVQHHYFLISHSKLYSVRPYHQLGKPLLAYAAGIIDGEGYIGISVSAERYYALRVEVANTSKALVDFLVKYFGGKYNVGKRPNRKIYFRWFLGPKHAEKFLEAIQQFIVIKREQVKLALEFRETRLNSDRKKFYAQIRNLNTQQYL